MAGGGGGGSGDEVVESMMAKVALECGGDISASQEDILARSSFLGGGHGSEEEPLTQQDHITICTLPFTPPQFQSPSPAIPDDGSQDDDACLEPPRNRKPRVCTRKVRGAARIRTPTPSPKQQQQDADPLYRAVLMIPTAAPSTTSPKLNPVEDFLALARHRGLFQCSAAWLPGTLPGSPTQ